MLLYADPGSGVLIWQLLLAIFFGATFYFSKLRHWATAKLRPERHSETVEKAAVSKSISENE